MLELVDLCVDALDSGTIKDAPGAIDFLRKKHGVQHTTRTDKQKVNRALEQVFPMQQVFPKRKKRKLMEEEEGAKEIPEGPAVENVVEKVDEVRTGARARIEVM